MKILVTGSAGFIGFHVSKKLVENGHKIVGIDNLNSYYDIKLKKNRHKYLKDKFKKNFSFFKIDLKNYSKLKKLFKKEKFDYVINLAAQAGVRMSIDKPDSYFDSNLVGFYNILKCCTNFKIKHLVAASSSSVYGEQRNNTKENYETSKPIQFYAATKKANEVMAHAFSNIYKTPITMIRFFTVYGPWGRPDMALYKFTEALTKKKEIFLYNQGNHLRDFTYIDDIVSGIILSLKKIPKKSKEISIPFEIYNLGNNKPVHLKKLVSELQRQLNIRAKIVYVKKQKGDVIKTSASILKARKKLGYAPKTQIEKGISKFLLWYMKYKQSEKFK